MKNLLLVPLLLLGGCSAYSPAPAPVAQAVICGTVAQITKEEQRAAANELAGMSANSIVANRIVPDWLRMRDEARACRNSK